MDGNRSLIEWLGRRRLVWLAVAGAASFAAFAAVIWTRFYGFIPGAILLAASVTLMFVYLTFWRESMVRMHRFLLGRAHWGELRRLVIFLAAFAAFPLITLLLPLLLVVIALG